MKEFKNTYFLGIGGIGMSALARYFHSLGYAVAGYDRTRSALCEKLEEEGMQIHYQDDPQQIPAKFKPKNTLVIYTPAVPEDLQEKVMLTKKGFELRKRSRVLGDIAKEHRCLAIAGTHGKTTTSTLLAHLFRDAGVPIAAFLGGISVNYQVNFWRQEGAEILVAEADEFDRSFLSLKPTAAAITSTDADHLDIYGEAETLKETFQEFLGTIQEKAFLRSGIGLPGGISYGLSPQADYRAEQIRVENGRFYFDLVYPQGRIDNIASAMPGKHNIENAVAAAALALNYGLTEEQVKTGIGNFKGIKRRFEYHIESKHTIYIDDYAHHPKELQALQEALRQLYPEKKITAIFQPHLYSRTRDFMEAFAEALSAFDRVILMDIYPARERPIPGITSAALKEQIKETPVELMGRQEILDRFKDEKPALLLTVGAGDIDQLIQPLKISLLQ